jgi:diaminopimelate epimerase
MMVREIPFEKWEGLGNDFILISSRFAPLLQGRLSPQNLCDRHFGVGADGVLLTSDDAPSMQVHNADGSRPEMCGNGLRCVAAAFTEAQNVHAAEVEVATDAGLRHTSVRFHGDTFEVSVDMGRVSFNPADAGVTATAADALLLETHGISGYVASIGNPHWVFIAVADHVDIAELGPALEVDPRFAAKTNVEFVRHVAINHWRVDVWERGVGITLACGTGACCVAATLAYLGLEPYDTPLRIELPGGSLDVEVSRDLSVRMTGPARRVFRGTLTVE